MANRYTRYLVKKFNQFMYYFDKSDKLLLKFTDYNRLRKFHQHAKDSVKAVFNDHEIAFTSPFWFLHSVDEIFVQEVYKFSSQTKTPFIIDCGANIGLSVMYFKKLFNEAKIIAFEADPKVCDLLEVNLSRYNYNNIEVINAAVWDKETTLSFFAEGSVGGMIDINHVRLDNQIEVPAIRLRNFLQNPVDFLKIDIEGAEYVVLKDCQDLLHNVKNLFIEYHILPDEEQTLHEVLTWVNNSGFKYYIREAWNNMTYPFLKSYNDYYQMQLNIFCYR